MKAIKISSYGAADVLKYSNSEPKPKPAAGQALVKIHVAGVNFVDIYQRRGTYPVQIPFIPGLEASGVVEEVGVGVTGTRDGRPGRLYGSSRELQRVYGDRRRQAHPAARRNIL